MRRNGVILFVLGAVLLFAPGISRAESKCTALKYKLAAKTALAKAKCRAVAVKDGGEVDPLCLAKAEAALAGKWASAEGKGDCLGTGDLASAQQAIDAFIAGLTEALAPPASTAVCCQGPDSCWHGQQFPDEASCVQFGTTAGAPGTVCDGATGTCRAPPAGTGSCCFFPAFSVCAAGPTLDLAGCVSAGGLDFPFSSTCLPNGTCTFPGP